MNPLTRDAILKAEDLKKEKVEVPEWGGFVYVRCMTGTERDDFEWENIIIKGDSIERNRKNFRARLLGRVIVDETGNRLFSDEDFEALGQKSGKALDRLFDCASKLNGLSKTDVEELTKN